MRLALEVVWIMQNLLKDIVKINWESRSTQPDGLTEKNGESNSNNHNDRLDKPKPWAIPSTRSRPCPTYRIVRRV